MIGVKSSSSNFLGPLQPWITKEHNDCETGAFQQSVCSNDNQTQPLWLWSWGGRRSSLPVMGTVVLHLGPPSGGAGSSLSPSQEFSSQLSSLGALLFVARSLDKATPCAMTRRGDSPSPAFGTTSKGSRAPWGIYLTSLLQLHLCSTFASAHTCFLHSLQVLFLRVNLR